MTDFQLIQLVLVPLWGLFGSEDELPPGELHRLWFILGYFDTHNHEHK